MIRVIIPPNWVPEKTYAFQLLLGEILGVPFSVATEATQKDYLLELPNGNRIEFADTFFKKKPDGAAFTPADMPVDSGQNAVYLALLRDVPRDFIPIIYGDGGLAATETTLTFNLDIAASTFFMATRWEESVMPDRDQYGRFPGKASWAYSTDNLNSPVVHRYAELIWDSMVQLGWPSEQRIRRKAQIVLSCDVDHLRLWWQPLEMLRTVGGAFKRGNAKAELTYWWQYLANTRRDPFDTFDQLIEFAGGNTVQFNFLGKRPRHFDCWYDIDHSTVLKTIRALQQAGHTIGFHPSREAHADRERFGLELESVRRVAGTPVTTGRHHYLLFDAPTTWQLWEDHGMTEDSTVGYRDVLGYRTGMAIDFPVFNFKTRKMLRLRERPLTIMDITFAEYQGEDPHENRQQTYANMVHAAAHLGVQLSILWHNSSIQTPKWASEWQAICALKAKFEQQATKYHLQNRT